MRALAALSVVAYHATQTGSADDPLTKLLSRLNVGVAVFFALSGFLLLYPFLAASAGHRPRPSLRGYALRRFARIVPAYWLCLTVSALMLNWPRVFSRDGWIYYGFAQIYAPADIANTGLAVAWSLDTEVSFYVALPAIATGLGAVLLRGGMVAALSAVGLAALVSIVIYAAVEGPECCSGWVVTLPATLALFAPGIALATLHVAACDRPRLQARLRRLAKPVGAWWLAAAAVYVALGIAVEDPPTSVWPPFAVLAGMLLFPVVCGDDQGWFRRVLGSRVLLWLGTVSYGIYLWHLQFVRWLGDNVAISGSLNRTVILSVVATVLAVSFAAVSYYGLERYAITAARQRARSFEDGPAN
jgi:peptidoglycan/LPS O-acetylase OafA/YrhL